MAQLAPGATDSVHVLLWAKSPFEAMLVMLSGAFPAFESVTVCATLVLPTSCRPKFNVDVESTGEGARGLGRERSHALRPCVAARRVREASCNTKSFTTTRGSPFTREYQLPPPSGV